MPKCYRLAILMIAAAMLTAAGMSFAAVPTRMTVQGKLTNAAGDPVPAGLKSFTFKIYDAQAGGTEIWPAGPGEVQPLSTDADGLWTAELGALVPLTDPVFSGNTRWLEVTVNDGVHPVETLPRIKLNTSPYTFRSAQTLNADNADNADNLGGQPPAAYAPTIHTHDATTVIDEPGITSNTQTGYIILAQGTTTMVDLITCMITTPSAGYIYVQGRTTFDMSATSGWSSAYCQIDEDQGGDIVDPHAVDVGLFGSGNIHTPIFVDRVYFKPAGTYVFRLEARTWNNNAPGSFTSAQNHRITACFYPTAYGVVIP